MRYCACAVYYWRRFFQRGFGIRGYEWARPCTDKWLFGIFLFCSVLFHHEWHGKEKYGFDNILLRDITGPVIPEISAKTWDYAILGELLEHIDNPVSYLGEIREKYQHVIDKIIITVPNVLTEQSFAAARRSSELINSDHRYWFSPYTIAKVMLQAGMELDEIFFANRIRLSFAGLVRKKLITLSGGQPKYRFNYAGSIVAIGRMKS